MKEIIRTKEVPEKTGIYSQAVKVGRQLFISGQVALDPDGNLIGKGDFKRQVEQVFKNMKAVLEAGGATFSDVVKLNIYLTNLDHLQMFQKLRKRYFGESNLPASTLVVVKSLVNKDFLLEVEAIAIIPE